MFLENYDMTLGALLTRGADVWLNNPRRPLEASGTSGMKAAMNGVPNLSILDGWWPEGCEHGVTGWKIGDPDPNDDAFDDKDDARVDKRDRELLLPGARDATCCRRTRDRAQVARDHAREHRDVAVAVLVGPHDRGLRDARLSLVGPALAPRLSRDRRMTRLRVLHLEGSQQDAEHVRDTLATAVAADVDRVETRAHYEAALLRGRYDVILADLVLPTSAGLDGMGALELAQRRCPEVPFLFVTGAIKDDTAAETLRRGATDLVIKARLARLVPAVQRAIRERAERAHRERAESSLEFIAATSARLAASLDLSATLGNLARLAIPALADFCTVDLAGDDERDPGAVAHVDAAMVDTLRRLRFRPHLVTTHVCELYDDVTPERMAMLAAGRDELGALQALRPTSLMMVPMVVNNRTIGTIAFGFSASGRRHDGRDLATARNLAERAAVAVENARLFREVQREVKARKDLLAIVSHDLRNPLQNILMTATLAQTQLAERDPLRPRIEAIARSAALATRLLTELLDLARFEAGHLELDRHVQDLAPLVREGLDQIAGIAEQRHVELVDEVSSGAFAAYCDRTRTIQILGNLLGNAIKFTPDGGTIRVTARLVAEREQVQIVVHDSGVGIAAQELPHVFDRFWQAKGRRGGVGLGLSIVKLLVDAQGGAVSVTSVPGTGSAFAFTLPAKPLALAADATTEARTVLIVEDDSDTRVEVAELLEEAGYQTLTAGNGFEALELLRREPLLRPSLVLLDLVMPRMDARTFRREMERDPALKDIAVIVFSAAEDVAIVARELNATGHLRKPIGARDLLAAVSRSLADRTARQSGPGSPATPAC